MQFLLDLGRRLRDLAESGAILQSDTLATTIRRNGLGTIWKICTPLYEVPELWSDDCPEADSDGIPSHPQHRAVLALLHAKGPLKVAAIASQLGVDASQLYRGAGDLKLLSQMGLAEKGADGYKLTGRGERVAGMLEEEEEG